MAEEHTTSIVTEQQKDAKQVCADMNLKYIEIAPEVEQLQK